MGPRGGEFRAGRGRDEILATATGFGKEALVESGVRHLIDYRVIRGRERGCWLLLLGCTWW